MLQSEALEILDSGANVFLTGQPGAGKTYTLNRFIEQARSEGRKVSVTASTGIAATQLDGQTIHSWTGVGVRKTLSPSTLSRIRRSRGATIQDADVLVIDEISMLPAYLLDLADRTCRYVRGVDAPFGGLQVVMSGDFFQLPPVPERDRGSGEYRRMMEQYPGPYSPEGFVTGSKVWNRLNLAVCYLTEQHRQTGDGDMLLKVLTDMRAGRVDDADVAAVRARIVGNPDDSDMVRLFPTNRQADGLNRTRLDRLDGETHTYTAFRHGDARRCERLLKNMLAPETLTLKTGARVMTVRNDTELGQYMNGSMGVVESFDDGLPVVRFDNGNTVQLGKAAWNETENETIVASVHQIPLRLAWGITIHKSQGMTLDGAVMDLSRTFAPGMGYVALSRVRSLDGLTLLGVNGRAFEVSDEAKRIDGYLHEASDRTLEHLERHGAEGFRPVKETLF